MMKRSAALLTVAAMTLAVAACTPASQNSEEAGGDAPSEITLAVALPTTGGSAVLGEPMTHGIEMAVAEINAAGGIDGATLKIVQEDLGADDAAALNAFNRLTSDNPAAVIGFPVSTQGFAVMTQVDRTGIPVVMGGTNSRLAAGSDWAFNMTSTDAVTSTAAAQFAAETLGVTKVGLLRESGELGTGASEVLNKAADTFGFEIVKEEIFQSGDVDLSSQANNLRASDAEMIFVYGQQADFIVAGNALATAGVFLPAFLGGVQPGTLEKMNKDAFEIIYNRNQCVPAAAKDGALAEWSAAYTEEFGAAPTEYAAIAYDGVHLIANALKEAGSTDPDALAKALGSAGETTGVCGVHYGGPDGNLSFGVTIGHYDESGAYVLDESLSVLP